MEKIVLKPGRFNPTQIGHILPDQWMLNDLRVDKIIPGISSRYELDYRNPIFDFWREKMYARSWMYKHMDLERMDFVFLDDFPGDFETWLDHIIRCAEIHRVTHFATGNREDILDVLRQKKLKVPFEIIDIENDLPEKYRTGYHSTDLRNAVYRGDDDLFFKIAAPGTIAMLDIIGGKKAIKDAIDGRGKKFLPGRQTVDTIILTRTAEGRRYVLTGFRKMSKGEGNFPGWLALPGGAIEEYESPLDTALREPGEETSIDMKYVYRYFEPSIISVKIRNGEILAELRFGGLWNSADPKLSGSQGGSSLVFISKLDVSPRAFDGMLQAKADLERVAMRPVDEVLVKGLAYEQTDMLLNALGKIEVESQLRLIGPIKARRVMNAVGSKIEKLKAA